MASTTAPKTWQYKLELAVPAKRLAEEPLDVARTLVRAVEDLEHQLGRVVEIARARGKSWSQIGEALGDEAVSMATIRSRRRLTELLAQKSLCSHRRRSGKQPWISVAERVKNHIRERFRGDGGNCQTQSKCSARKADVHRVVAPSH